MSDDNFPLPASTTNCLAVLGTASDVGKSLMTAAFCRLFSDEGLRVAPYKAQNMSNNSYVAVEGGEVGRAQHVQAVAARVETSIHHNPVLLKPSADDCSQVIVHGRSVGNAKAREYFADTGRLKRAASESLARLRADHDVVVIEGAGSCAEVNLRSREFVNFPVAHDADAKVVLVADIDKGGVFAQLVGTLEVMPAKDRSLVAGLLVNKFRGDLRLFDDGVTYLEQRTGLPVLGVVPFLYECRLDSEDAVPTFATVDPPPGLDEAKLKIAVLRLPHISNFTDVDALARTPGVAVHYLYRPRELFEYAAVIVPGSKSVVADLAWLRNTGVAERLTRYHNAGGRILGLCGGYQLLGRRLIDEHGLEGAADSVAGLDFIDVETRFESPKIVRRVHGHLFGRDEPVAGFEIHHGRTTSERFSPLTELIDSAGRRYHDGFRDDQRRIWGTYVHGLLDTVAVRRAFLEWADPTWQEPALGSSTWELTRAQWLEGQIDGLARHVRQHVDWQRIRSWF